MTEEQKGKLHHPYPHPSMLLASLFLAAFAHSLASPVPVTVPGSTFPSPVCVAAAAMTASQCDPTRTRTIFDILYSCIGVILLCTYISIHHNIPDQGDSWVKATWLKLRTTLYALVVPEIVIMWAIRQWIMARKIARTNKHRGWTKTHGFFIQMGGLVRKRTGREVAYQVVCDPDKLNGMKIPFIPEKEIQDHGKGDLLAKAVVVVQTTWFVAQCIARHVQGLILTEIELVTLAFATLNVVTYGLWWNKPLNVGYPIYFDEDGNRVDGPLAANGESEEDQGQVKEWEEAWYARIWRSMSSCVAGCSGVFRHIREGWGDYREEYGKVALFVAPFEAVFHPLLDMMSDAPENRPTSVHPFYSAKLDFNDRDLAVFYGSGIGIVFGGIHLIGWNYQFPTIVEVWLWRTSALALTSVPPFLAVGVALVSKYNYEMVLGLTAYIGGPLYFTARIVILFLAFFTLRDLSDAAYQNVRWTELIPHI
ncbi:hypothetical protein AX16_007928 [Volvariella volvacea WC 439]|nr:hypothetical protein AX16_007928 [Volvariella volvacea WC 439]